ncbi:hypothetical protein [Homoserinibacter sp. GY 40078]|uniref:hypothetical protein n=1 Tax=Homoserinibacter sp. GY 40078 TaxID=2603275 RepID=UPI0011CAD05F|nr:hypothetical protein [Homoserinibacter sp. GY 40078]TXK17741.1 hypothetical protein FVQ89_13160 [Homoserinibacter sp. GY 40078]
MSCIRFNTPAQRAQLSALAPSMLTPEEVARLHPAPAVTESKLRRLRLLAADANPKIRESVASSYHAPTDLYETLAQDPDEGVRACIARNTTVSCDLLRELSHDDSATVRGWVAVNYFVPADVMDELADDPDPTVRGLVAWKASLTEDEAVTA